MEKRIQNASLLLDASLGHCFQDGLEHRDTNVIFNCLRAYATRRAEEIFRSATVAQLIQKIIPHSLSRVVGVGASRDELEEDYKQIKQYIEKDYKFLLEISSTMEESKFVFEAKTIQIIELLVLSTLQWKMNHVTSLSFVDHIVRRFGFKTDLYLEFLWRCERLLLSAITDSRFGCYLPSILVTATMLHVIKEVEPSNVLDCQNELMDIIKMSKVFRKGSPLVPEISRAIGQLRENGTLMRIEQAWFNSPPSLGSAQNSSVTNNSSLSRLNFDSFRGLFLISGLSSASALVILSIQSLYQRWHAKVHRFRNLIC